MIIFAAGVLVGLIVGAIVARWDFRPPLTDVDRVCALIDMELDTLADIRSLPEVPYGR